MNANHSRTPKAVILCVTLVTALVGCAKSVDRGSELGPRSVIINSDSRLQDLVAAAHGLVSDKQVRAAREELRRRRDPACVPLLLDVLVDKDAGDLVGEAYLLIGELGDKRCLPFLVPLADKCSNAELTASIYLDGSSPLWHCLAARRTIFFLVNPDGRAEWNVASIYAPGASTREIEALEAFRNARRSYERVNVWYRQWRCSYDHTQAFSYRKAVEVWQSRRGGER